MENSHKRVAQLSSGPPKEKRKFHILAHLAWRNISRRLARNEEGQLQGRDKMSVAETSPRISRANCSLINGRISVSPRWPRPETSPIWALGRAQAPTEDEMSTPYSMPCRVSSYPPSVWYTGAHPSSASRLANVFGSCKILTRATALEAGNNGPNPIGVLAQARAIVDSAAAHGRGVYTRIRTR